MNLFSEKPFQIVFSCCSLSTGLRSRIYRLGRIARFAALVLAVLPCIVKMISRWEAVSFFSFEMLLAWFYNTIEMIPQYVHIQSTEHGHQTKEQIKTMQCRTLNRLYVNLNTDFKDAQILNLYIFSIIITLPVER